MRSTKGGCFSNGTGPNVRCGIARSAIERWSLPDVLTLMDSQLNLVFESPSSFRCFGYDSPNDAIGCMITDYIPAIKPGLKVLFISGYASDIIAYHGILEEAMDFIRKPFNVDDLAKAFQNMIRP